MKRCAVTGGGFAPPFKYMVKYIRQKSLAPKPQNSFPNTSDGSSEKIRAKEDLSAIGNLFLTVLFGYENKTYQALRQSN